MKTTNVFRAAGEQRDFAVAASAFWLLLGLIAWHQTVLRTLAVF